MSVSCILRPSISIGCINMTASIMIHQPHFLPWYPYIARMNAVESIVFLDDVMFRKNYFQNRTKILCTNQKQSWIQIPIRRHERRPINRTELAPNLDEHLHKIQTRFDSEFKKAAFYRFHREELFSFLKKIENGDFKYLSDLNVESIRLIFSMLNLKPPRIYLSSEISNNTADPTSRIISICREIGCNNLLTGYGASHSDKVHKHSELLSNNIKLISFPKKTSGWQFHDGISILQWIFERGAEDLLEFLNICAEGRFNQKGVL